MNKRFTKLIAALALLVGLTIPLGMWGQTRATETFDFSDYTGQGGPSGSGSEYTMVKTDVSISDTKFYGNTSFVNLYAGGVSTITPASGVTITQIVLTATGSSYNGFQSSGTVTPSTGSISHDDTSVTWTGSANVAFTISHNKQIRWTSIEVTYTSGGQQPTTYTVTYDCNGGTSGCPENVTGIAANTQIQLAGAPTKTDYTFNGWSDGNTTYQAGADYTVTGNVTFTAQWTENTTPSGNSATLTQSNLGLTGSYTSNTEKTIDGITYVYTDLMKNNDNIQAKASTGTIKNTTAYPGDITSVVITHSGTARATTINGSADGENWTQVATGSGSITADFSGKGYKYFQITRGSNAAYWEAIIITWADANAPSITANNMELDYDATSGNISYTINNAPTSAGTLTATVANGEWLSLGTVGETVPFTCSVNEAATERTATVTLTYTYNRETVTKDVTITQAGNPNIVDNISDITAAGTYAVQGTIVAKSTKGFIVGDGTGYVYYYKGNDFDASNYAIGDMVKLDGSVVVYGGVFEFNSETTISAATESNYQAEEPSVLTGAQMDERVTSTTPAQLSSYVQYEGALSVNDTHYNITNIEGATTAQGSISYPVDTDFASLNGKTVKVMGYYVGISSSKYYNTMIGSIEEVAGAPIINADNVSIAADATSGEIAYTITNAVEGTSLNATTEAAWISNIVVGASSITFTTTPNEVAEERSAVFTLTYEGAENLEVTVTQAAYTVDYATLTLNWAGGTREELLALNGVTANGLGTDYAEGNAPYRVKFDTDGDYIQVKTDSRPGGVIIGVKMLGGANSSSIKVQASVDGETFDDGEVLTISGAQNSVLTLRSTREFGENVRYVRLYFTKGSNVGVGPIAIYKYTEYNILSITGYGEGSGNWYLVASPVTTTPEAAGMITDELGSEATSENATYDLYYYNHNAEDGLEWRNYRTQNFELTPGTGYLYANKNNVTLTFTGTAYEGDGSFNLVSGWNLVGNPFAVTAYIGRNFYTMNPAGSELIACTTSNDPIEAMHAVFVEGGDEDYVTFSTTAPEAKSQIVALNVTKNRGTAIDRAIVRFDEGDQLPKFQLNPNNTKLYVAQGNKDYAIVRSAAQGEMPVSFRAAENGTYTLSIETENVEMNYLHLIDNLTGMDVDLLATPNYTFEAKTSDYASRFRLVYSANSIDEQNAETFAFFNGSEWMVSNLGEATLQVVDVMGRVLSTETITGNAELNLNQPAGVYMLRLINGNDVKVQKVVVR